MHSAASIVSIHSCRGSNTQPTTETILAAFKEFIGKMGLKPRASSTALYYNIAIPQGIRKFTLEKLVERLGITK